MMTLQEKRKMRTGIVTAILVGGLQCAACAQDAFPEFKAKVIDANIGKVCYAVTHADVDGDGKRGITGLLRDGIAMEPAGTAPVS